MTDRLVADDISSATSLSALEFSRANMIAFLCLSKTINRLRLRSSLRVPTESGRGNLSSSQSSILYLSSRCEVARSETKRENGLCPRNVIHFVFKLIRGE